MIIDLQLVRLYLTTPQGELKHEGIQQHEGIARGLLAARGLKLSPIIRGVVEVQPN